MNELLITQTDKLFDQLQHWNAEITKIGPRVAMNIIKGGMLDGTDKETLDWYREQRTWVINHIKAHLKQMKDEGIVYHVPAGVDMDITFPDACRVVLLGEEEEYDEGDEEDFYEDLEDPVDVLALSDRLEESKGGVILPDWHFAKK